MRTDAVIRHIMERLPSAVAELVKILDSATTDAFRKDLERLGDVRLFLQECVLVCDQGDAVSLAILKRHTDVQHGKFDRGRRKMPWVENVDGQIRLTTTRVGGLNREATTPDDIVPHPYRLDSAHALIAAARRA